MSMIIDSEESYRFFLEADRIALNIAKPEEIKNRFSSHFGDVVWHFEQLLRKNEYYLNCQNSTIGKPYRRYLRYKLFKEQIRTGLNIPQTVLDQA